MDKEKIYTILSEMLPSQLDELVIKLDIPAKFLTHPAPSSTTAKEIIRLATQHNKIAELEAIIGDFSSTISSKLNDGQKGSERLQTTQSTPNAEALPDYVSILRRDYTGHFGFFVIGLAIVTLLPVVLAVKLHLIKLNISIATGIFIIYHGIGMFLWLYVGQGLRPRIHYSEKKWKRLYVLGRIHDYFSYFVWLLIILTILCLVRVHFFAPYCLRFPLVVYEFLGIEAKDACNTISKKVTGRDPACGVEEFNEEAKPPCSVQETIYKLGTSFVCGSKKQEYVLARSEYCQVEKYKEKASLLCDESRVEKYQSYVEHESWCCEGHLNEKISVIPPNDEDGRKFLCNCQRVLFLASCRKSEFGVELYKECRDPHHGLEPLEPLTCRNVNFGIERQIYTKCKNELFGVKTYRSCTHNS